MTKVLYGNIAIIMVVVGLFVSCSNYKKTDETKKPLTSVETVSTDSLSNETDTIANGKSLNDIRFANFTDKDWLDNEYIRTLRKYLDSFICGKVKDEDIEPYKNDIKGKFIIANVEPFLLGGLFIQIIFIEKPENVFTAWVYSDVDEDAEKIVGYSVRRISLDERKNELSKEQIFQEMKEHPELKLW